jgi:DNA-binding transcriptional LysR family regulator
MEISRLKYFRSVVETKSVRKAAEVLSLTPGALSKSLKVLEEEVGKKLLVPDGRGIAITDAGMQLYTLSLRLLEEHELVVRSMAGSTPESTLRIGTFEVFSTYFFSRFLKDFRPDIPVVLSEQGPGEMEKSILDKKIDFGLTYIPYPNEELEMHRVCRFEFKVFSNSRAFRGVADKDIRFSVPITAVNGTPLEIDGLDCWPQHADRRHIYYRFEMLETALQAASFGLAALYCPEFVVKLYNDMVRPEWKLTALETNFRMRSNQHYIYLIHRKGNLDSLSHVKPILKAIRMLCRR